jgi:hypothetical protein
MGKRKLQSLSSRRKRFRSKTYVFTRKLYRFMRRHPDKIFFEKLPRDIYGYYEPDTHDIILDYRRDLVSTLIHEFLHHLYHNWCETKVERMEKKMINTMSRAQVRHIIKVLGEIFSPNQYCRD